MQGWVGEASRLVPMKVKGRCLCLWPSLWAQCHASVVFLLNVPESTGPRISGPHISVERDTSVCFLGYVSWQAATSYSLAVPLAYRAKDFEYLLRVNNQMQSRQTQNKKKCRNTQKQKSDTIYTLGLLTPRRLFQYRTQGRTQ